MPKNRLDEKSARNSIIYQEKKNGTAVSDLAKKYNLSLPRIHRICLKEENKDLKQQNMLLEARLAYYEQLNKEE